MNQKTLLPGVLGFLTLGFVFWSASPTPLGAAAEPWTLGVAVQTGCQGDILPCT